MINHKNIRYAQFPGHKVLRLKLRFFNKIISIFIRLLNYPEMLIVASCSEHSHSEYF
ncbi:MAG: hypothetical protein H6Q19_1322 [Bacteroidetes bacterium]|nr:hypothetical protein [Bacteroidota bacterium]